MSTIVLLAIGQLRTRHCVVVDGVGRLDLDIHPQVASVRLANRRLGRGAPLPVADRQHPAMQRHLDVLDRQRRGRPGCAAVGGEKLLGGIKPASTWQGGRVAGSAAAGRAHRPRRLRTCQRRLRGDLRRIEQHIRVRQHLRHSQRRLQV
jgi:hypothetical protein